MTKIIKTEINDNGNSYLIDFGDNMLLWFDTWYSDNNEFTGDWNKYIFYTSDKQDMKEQAFQNAHNNEIGAYNFNTALELCEQHELDK